MALKPALCELHKKHPVCTKIGLFDIENRKKFLRRGTAPSPDPSPGGEGDTPSPHLTPLSETTPANTESIIKPYIHSVDINKTDYSSTHWISNWFFLEFDPLNFTHFTEQSTMHHNLTISTLSLSSVVFSLSTTHKQNETNS